MNVNSRRSNSKRGLALAALLIGGLLSLAGQAAQANRAGGTAVAQEVLNHFTCYSVVETPAVNVRVELTDQFVTDRRRVRHPDFFCNPATKEHAGQVTPPVNPDAHLKCYRIVPHELPRPTRQVEVRNQLTPDGEVVKVFAGRYLCAPATKDRPDLRPEDLGLDHFKCYTASGQPLRLRLRLTDQFVAGEAVVARLVQLCNPVDKTRLDTGEQVLRQFPDRHLACYRITPNPALGLTVSVEDQFRVEPTTVDTLKMLCVPSQKQVVESKVQDPNTKFFGVFAGTDGTGNDVHSELDPCRFDVAVLAWLGWAAARTTVLTEDPPPAGCDQNGRATEKNFRDAIEALKPGGAAADKPTPRDELVVFVSAHGTCGQLELEAGGGHDGTITDTDLRDLLSGFPRSVTITVILSICQDGFAEALMGIRDDNGQLLEPGHVEVSQASRSTETSFAGPPVEGAGSNFTTAIVDCLANKAGKTVADADFGNGDGMTWSLELHVCAAPLTTLITAYCVQEESDTPPEGLRYIADKSFGNNDGTMTAEETSKCALDSWRGGKAAVKSLIDKAKNGPGGLGTNFQHPTFKELGDVDKDPNHPDIDADGITNVDEIKTLNRVTNPFRADTDADGLNDKAEVDKACQPVDPDTDNDGTIDSDDPGCQ